MYRLPRLAGPRSSSQIKSFLCPPRSVLQFHIRIPRSSQVQSWTNARTKNTSLLSPLSTTSFRTILLRRLRSYRHWRRPYSSTSSPPSSNQIVYATIGVCCLAYGYQIYARVKAIKYHDPSLIIFFGQNMVTSLQNWREGRWWTLVTSSISHLNLFHLGVNMFALYSMGPLVVEIFGVGGYALTWVGSSIACCGFTLWWENLQEQQRKMGKQPLEWMGIKMERKPHERPQAASAGASGSVLGFLTALMLFAPHIPIQVFPLPLTFHLWTFNLLFATASTFCMVSGVLPQIGHAGHLGGMAGGLVCGRLLLRQMFLRR